MFIDNVRIIAPSIYTNEKYSEAEILGILLFLWYKNEQHRVVALDIAIDTLYAIIHSKNFAIFIADGQPIGYLNWAYFSAEEEINYINQKISYENAVKQYSKDQSDKRLWILTFFNNQKIQLMRYLGKKYIFKNKQVYFIYHKNNKEGTRNIIKKSSY